MNKCLRLCAFIVFSCTFCLSSFAIPAKRVRRTLQLADGSTVEATLRGDEHVHFWQTDDGRFLRESSEDGLFRQVEPDALFQKWTERMEERNNARSQRRVKRKAQSGAESNPISGQKKGLVILVNFKNRDMHYSRNLFDRFFNEVGFSEYRMAGSVHDYFLSQSYGQFDLTFDVAGPVTVSNNLEYYGENDSQGYDKHPAEMIIEACQLLDDEIDFSRYDWDNDGEVEQVFVIYAGYAESSGAQKYTIWPHEYTLHESKYIGDGSGAITLDGVVVDTYACSNELIGTSGNSLEGIGVPCHEFSHCMCLPDMYDTGKEDNFGMNAWDLLDFGSYNSNGKCPASYTSYERMYCGWLTPVALEDGGRIEEMPPLTSEPVAYIIYNQASPHEYYLLENRQNESWDAALYGHGMLILHVDFDASAWYNNTVNTKKNHQRMTIIPADGALAVSTVSLAGDPWPGRKQNTALTDTSSPAAMLYNKNTDGSLFMHFPIDEIAEVNGLISFRFNGGIGVPRNLQATEIGTDAFTVQWDEVKGAMNYEIMLSEVDTSSVVVNPTGEDAGDAQTRHHQIPGGNVAHYSTVTNSYSFTSLSPSHTYSVQVRATNVLDESSWTEPLSVSLKGQDAIDEVRQTSSRPVVSDLQGRRVTGVNLSKGIYIMNGKKVAIK